MSEINNANPLEAFTKMLDTIMEIPDESLNEETTNAITTRIVEGLKNDSNFKQALNAFEKNLDDTNTTRADALASANSLKESFKQVLEELKPSVHKKAILETIFNTLNESFAELLKKYHVYNIELPIQLDEGAHMPTYAHESDAAADVYAIADQVIPAHSLANVVHTGVRFGTPEGWKIKLSPRSSIGMKTPLRLSNMIGLIDTDYRGELMILFDNNSDSDYTIHAGDRVAQVELEKVYRFKPIQVDKVDETVRGEGGMGSTGK